MQRCSACRHEDEDESRFCTRCGAWYVEEEEAGEGEEELDRVWVFYGTLITLCSGIMVGSGSAFAVAMSGERLGIWGMLGMNALGYFVGGLLTARLSPGRTLAEPAVGAAIASLIAALLTQFGSPDPAGPGFLYDVVVAFAAALAGAWAGEKLQDAACAPHAVVDPTLGLAAQLTHPPL